MSSLDASVAPAGHHVTLKPGAGRVIPLGKAAAPVMEKHDMIVPPNTGPSFSALPPAE